MVRKVTSRNTCTVWKGTNRISRDRKVTNRNIFRIGRLQIEIFLGIGRLQIEIFLG